MQRLSIAVLIGWTDIIQFAAGVAVGTTLSCALASGCPDRPPRWSLCRLWVYKCRGRVCCRLFGCVARQPEQTRPALKVCVGLCRWKRAPIRS